MQQPVDPLPATENTGVMKFNLVVAA